MTQSLTFCLLAATWLAGSAAAVATDAPARTHVAPETLQALAVSSLRARAAQDGVDGVTFASVGAPADIAVDGTPPTLVALVPTPWLRERIPVKVRITADAHVTTATVWVSATAPADGPVYADDHVRGAAGADIAVIAGVVDRARTRGAPAATDATRAGARLRRAVRSGQAVLASDFEPMPLVQAQQRVAIQAEDHGVRLSVAGIALADGAEGDSIPVRWSGGERPVRARVINHEVVRIEQ